MENSAAVIVPALLRNIVTSTIISADNSLLNLAEKYNLHQMYRLLQIFQRLLISSFLFFLGILPSVFSFLSLPLHTQAFKFAAPKSDLYAPLSLSSSAAAAVESGVARALAQLLVILNDVPVSSRKYEIVRSLAELLIDENHRQGFESLRELNRRVLAEAFARALAQLEAAASEIDPAGGIWGSLSGLADFGLGRVYRAVRGVGEVVLGRFVDRTGGRCEYSAEKLAAELLWLAQKMAACGIVDEAVCRWASASNLASLGLSTEPRLQGSLIKVSAFLLKQAKTLEGESDDDSKNSLIRRMRMNMLMSWLPLLCHASNGTDAPVLSGSEKAELERVLGETIESLALEEQEKVLSLWIQHFSHCSNSDWPNLQSAFLRWCNTSRKIHVLK